MPHLSAFHRTALATVLSLLAAATIVTHHPVADTGTDGRKSGEHGIAAKLGKGDSLAPRAN